VFSGLPGYPPAVFVSSVVALNDATPTALWAFEEDTAGEAIAGTNQDPIPISLYCASAIYIGGPAVDSTDGYVLPANTPLALSVFGAGEILYGLSESATPSVFVLMGRQ